MVNYNYDEWEDGLKAKYGDFLEVGIIGVEDIGIMYSPRNVKIEKQRTGNFRLGVLQGTGLIVEGHIFPVPWLHYNSSTLTEQLKLFYNLPNFGNEGVIDEVEQPARVKKIENGFWEVVEKGRIRFKAY